MSVKQTTLFPPPVRDTSISDALRKYLFSLQMLGPLNIVDTTLAPEVIALPQPGLTSSQTGQSNQNQELIFIKGSADANTVQITGAISGTVILTKQYDVARFKSDATSWWVAGVGGSITPVVANFADEETPAGTVNGINTVFTLAHTPNPAKSLQLFNGEVQKSSGTDFTLSLGNTITFVVAPTAGSNLVCWYRY